LTLAVIPLITLTTDFGSEDAYVGVMKGVILGINPQARLVDLTHAVQPQEVFQASFLLGTSFRYFPPGTIHLAVVDPGVGSSRRALAVQAGGSYFVAPDNGLLSHVLSELGVRNRSRANAPAPTRIKRGLRAVSLTEPRFWLHPVSSTFHGRDIFAPVAAHLSRGVRLEDLGEEVSSILLYPISVPRRQPDGALLGRVLHIDHFGNLVTDIKEKDLPEGVLAMAIGGRIILGLSRSYSGAGGGDVPSLLAIIGSAGHLEVSARNGSAATLLGVGLGEPVSVRLHDET